MNQCITPSGIDTNAPDFYVSCSMIINQNCFLFLYLSLHFQYQYNFEFLEDSLETIKEKRKTKEMYTPLCTLNVSPSKLMKLNAYCTIILHVPCTYVFLV